MLSHEAENDITRVISNQITASTPQSCNQTLISLKLSRNQKKNDY